MQTTTYDIVSWKSIKPQIIKLNPFIGKAIDSAKNIDDFSVVKIRYPFGANIVKRGQFHIQLNAGTNISLNSSETPHELKKLFDYPWQVMPFGVMLHNTIETHTELCTHKIPIRLYHPGRTFSLLSIFEDPKASHLLPHAYSTTAGCRSLLTLPQIAHRQYQERLTKRLHLPEVYCPKHFSEQWDCFKAISESSELPQNWYAEIAYFSKPFFHLIHDTPEIKDTLLSSIWKNTTYGRNQGTYDLIWSAFIEENLSLSQRNNLAIMETIRYLMRVIMGASPAYQPAVDDSAGPINEFMHAFTDIYRIRFYLPVFMEISDFDGKHPLYYSLHKPAFWHAIPRNHSTTNQTINELKQIKTILDLFKKQVLNNRLPFCLENTPLYRRLEKIQFDCYHPKGKSPLKTDIKKMMHEDPRFAQIAKHYPHAKKLSLPDSSMFFNGCIRIKPISE